jgi:hypothetical protein
MLIEAVHTNQEQKSPSLIVIDDKLVAADREQRQGTSRRTTYGQAFAPRKPDYSPMTLPILGPDWHGAVPRRP